MPPPKLQNSTANVPKLALGRGAIALVKENGFALEILDPAGRKVASFTTDDPAKAWSWLLSWSPAGDALIHELPADGGSAGLRILDFSAGKDRFLLEPPSGTVFIGGSSSWFGPERVFVKVHSLWEPYYPVPIWTFGIKGDNLAPFEIQLPRAEGEVNLAKFNDLEVNDVSPDGRQVLITVRKLTPETSWGSEWDAAFVMNLDTSALTRVSPADRRKCRGRSFTSDARLALINCYDDRYESLTVFLATTDGSHLEELTTLPPDTRVHSLSPDGSMLALVRQAPPPSYEPIGILLLDIATRKSRSLIMLKADADGYLKPVGFTPDGKGFLVLRVREEERRVETGRLQRVELSSGRTTTVAEDVNEAIIAE